MGRLSNNYPRIVIHKETKDRLDSYGKKKDSYDRIINKFIDFQENYEKERMTEAYRNLQETLSGSKYDFGDYKELRIYESTFEKIKRITETRDETYSDTVDFLIQFYYDRIQPAYVTSEVD